MQPAYVEISLHLPGRTEYATEILTGNSNIPSTDKNTYE
jgi:hypothetical protein